MSVPSTFLSLIMSVPCAFLLLVMYVHTKPVYSIGVHKTSGAAAGVSSAESDAGLSGESEKELSEKQLKDL